MDKEKMNNDPQNTSEEITERIEEMIEEETETGAGTVSISDRLREAEADENDYDADVEDGYDEEEYDEADGEVDGENEYGEASEDAEYVEDEYSEEEEEEDDDDDDEPRIVVSPKVVKVASLILFSGIILVFASIAWFTMNKDVGMSGMGVKTKGLSFELITLSGDNTNKNGVYYDPYHTAIRENESEGYDIWLVNSGSNINNYSNTGTDDGTLGIEPGSSGIIKFYIKPYEDVTVAFTFQTLGYSARTTTVGGQPSVTMTELSSAAGRPACFLNGHVLLFEHQDSTTHFYSGLIPTGADGKRTFTRYFELNGPYDADTDSDGTNDAYEVEIYWIWPMTLDTLVDNSNPSVTMICDKNASPAQGETDNDYTKVVNNICSYPQYYIKGYSPTTTYTEATIKGRNAMYNDADQEIGMNVEYVLLRLDAEAGTGE